MMTAREPWLVFLYKVVLGLDLLGYLVLSWFELLWGLPLGGGLVVNWQLLAQLLLQLLLLEMHLKVLVLLLQMLRLSIIHVHLIRDVLVHQYLLVAVCNLAHYFELIVGSVLLLNTGLLGCHESC